MAKAAKPQLSAIDRMNAKRQVKAAVASAKKDVLG